jgi:hypothetical protein
MHSDQPSFGKELQYPELSENINIISPKTSNKTTSPSFHYVGFESSSDSTQTAFDENRLTNDFLETIVKRIEENSLSFNHFLLSILSMKSDASYQSLVKLIGKDSENFDSHPWRRLFMYAKIASECTVNEETMSSQGSSINPVQIQTIFASICNDLLPLESHQQFYGMTIYHSIFLYKFSQFEFKEYCLQACKEACVRKIRASQFAFIEIDIPNFIDIDLSYHCGQQEIVLLLPPLLSECKKAKHR